MPEEEFASSHERSELRFVPREFGFRNSRGGVFHHCKASGEEYIADVVDCFPEEGAFPKLYGDSGVLKEVKDLVDVLDMLLYILGEIQYIVEVDEADPASYT